MSVTYMMIGKIIKNDTVVCNNLKENVVPIFL